MKLFKTSAILLLIVLFTSSCTVNIIYPENGVVDYLTGNEDPQEADDPAETGESVPEAEGTAKETDTTQTTAYEETADEPIEDIKDTVSEEITISETEEYIPPIYLIYLTSPISKNQTAEIDILGRPCTEYSIEVFYATGKSNAAGLKSKISNEVGTVTWTWKIGPSVKSGYYKIVVTGGGTSFETEIQVY